MAYFQTKASRMAVVTEVTEGTPVAPTSGTSYIALQDGYDLEASFTELENKELTGSLGPAKKLLGLEEPKASLNHYIRHSGIEGTEPNFGKLIEGILGGKSVNATQYDTIGGSTAGNASAAATVVVDTGEGAFFERGEALLIKDGSNGYSIRNVLSVASDTLTLNFNLSNAPASGVNLGKAVLYKPGTGSSYPTFSVWDYRGNGAATQLMAGGRVLEMGIDATAGDFINGSFSLEGLSYYFNPIELTSSNNKLDFNDGGVKAASISVGFYKDPKELAAAVETAMDTLSSDTITCTYSDTTGKFTITTTGGTLSLLWNTGANTAQTIGGKLGFITTSDDTGFTSYTSDNALVISSPQTPSFDDADPLVAKANEVLIGDFASSALICPKSISMKITGAKTDVECVRAESGKVASINIERKVTIDIVATLQNYEVDTFHRFHTNQDTVFMWNFGEKSGTNWVAGKSANVYIPTCTISKFKIADDGGLVSLEMSLSAFVNSSSQGEVYINFV